MFHIFAENQYKFYRRPAFRNHWISQLCFPRHATGVGTPCILSYFWCFFYKYISFLPFKMAVVLLKDLCHPLFMFGADETCSHSVLSQIICASGLGEQRGVMIMGRDGQQRGAWCASREAPVVEDTEFIFDQNWSIEAWVT